MIRLLKPTTPGSRKTSYTDFSRLTKKAPEKSLLATKHKTGGRNNQGKITCRHIGGGAKQFYRMVDFSRTDKNGIVGKITALEYDPNRTAFIALVVYKDGAKRYHLAAETSRVGDEIVCAEKTKVKAGNRMMLKNIPQSFDIYNVELRPGSKGTIVRSAGTSAKLIGFDGHMAQIQLPSGEIRHFDEKCYATIGKVSNEEWGNVRIGRAGRQRHRGIRPSVRGKAMNPVDHPHGGGEGHNPIGLKYPKTPWGKHALGVPTRDKKKQSAQFIIRNRKGRQLIKEN